MSKWDMVKLSDMFTLQMGKTPSRDNPDYWNGNKKWVSISDLGKISKYITNTKECITDIAVSETGIKITPKDTIIMSFKLSIGKTAITVEDIYTNEAIMSFIDNGIYEFDLDYIYYLFSGKDWNEGTNKAVMGITLNKATLSQIRIPLPPIDNQRQIAKNLDKVTHLIDLCNAILEKLDLLVKARFLEMFGDSVNNDKHWNTLSVEEVCDEIYGGGTPSKAHPEYYENGNIPWISSKDMKCEIITESQIYINQLGVENSTARMVPVNSVIMVIRSGILKHTLPVAINAVPITVNQDLKVFIPNDKMLTRFLAIQFKMHEKDILSGVRAVTADNIEFNSLKQRTLIVPPIDMQQSFVYFVEQTDKSKSAVKQVLEKAETLKKALMQEYFK